MGKPIIFIDLVAELLVQARQYSSEFIKDIIKIQSTVAVNSVFFRDVISFYNVSVSIGCISIKKLRQRSL